MITIAACKRQHGVPIDMLPATVTSSYKPCGNLIKEGPNKATRLRNSQLKISKHGKKSTEDQAKEFPPAHQSIGDLEICNTQVHIDAQRSKGILQGSATLLM
jgi:hypothetical protein